MNLKKILQTLTDYYSEVLNHSLTGFPMPALNVILESTNSADVNIELSHFLQLVLGCAVNCKRKSEFINKIMELNEYTQHMIMTAIQDVNFLINLIIVIHLYIFECLHLKLMCKDRNQVAKSSSTWSLTNTNDEDINYQVIETNFYLMFETLSSLIIL